MQVWYSTIYNYNHILSFSYHMWPFNIWMSQSSFIQNRWFFMGKMVNRLPAFSGNTQKNDLKKSPSAPGCKQFLTIITGAHELSQCTHVLHEPSCPPVLHGGCGVRSHGIQHTSSTCCVFRPGQVGSGCDPIIKLRDTKWFQTIIGSIYVYYIYIYWLICGLSS